MNREEPVINRIITSGQVMQDVHPRMPYMTPNPHSMRVNQTDEVMGIIQRSETAIKELAHYNKLLLNRLNQASMMTPIDRLSGRFDGSTIPENIMNDCSLSENIIECVAEGLSSKKSIDAIAKEVEAMLRSNKKELTTIVGEL